jgi:hypothetical protein
LGLAGIPAIIITISGVILSDTPNSLVHWGKQQAGRKVLERMRGITNVDIEFEDILIASNQKSSEERNALKNVFKGKSIPPLIVSCIFQSSANSPALMTSYSIPRFYFQLWVLKVVELILPQLF